MKRLRHLIWLLVPMALLAEPLHLSAGWIFLLCCAALIPLAGAIGGATEQLAHRMGPAAGGLFNASFGNAAELIIGIVALSKGLTVVVKASITGSILGNLLLVTGAAMLAGGWKRKSLPFSSAAAGAHAAQLALAVVGLLVPGIFFHAAESAHQPGLVNGVSLGVSGILILTYFAGLGFAFKTHSHLFSAAHPAEAPENPWSTKRAMATLIAASATTAILAEELVGAIEPVAKSYGMTEVFLGVVLLALVGNAAEHATAVLLARKGQMDTALQITMQSSLQIALFVAPVLVFLSHALGHPMELVFTELEIISVVAAVAVVIITTLDGETNWFEGFQLLAVYAILAVAFYFLPPELAGIGHGAVSPVAPK